MSYHKSSNMHGIREIREERLLTAML